MFLFSPTILYSLMDLTKFGCGTLILILTKAVLFLQLNDAAKAHIYNTKSRYDCILYLNRYIYHLVVYCLVHCFIVVHINCVVCLLCEYAYSFLLKLDNVVKQSRF